MADSSKAPLSQHLRELKIRILMCVGVLIISFGISYYFAENAYDFLVQPLADIYEGQTGRRLIYTGLTEAFFTYLKIAFYMAMFVSFPFMMCQLYLFLAPAMHKEEKMAILPFMIASPLFFIAGAALVYYYIFPMAWSFFLSFEDLGSSKSLPVEHEARISEYLSLVMQLIFAFGIAFQLPILLSLLAKFGFISAKSLAAKRKYALVAIVGVAAVLTPPDLISQVGLVIPLLILYEISIVSCKLLDKSQKTSRF